MKTVTTLITAMALATASAAVNAAETQSMPLFTPYTPFAMTEAQQTAMVEHQKLIAEQHRAFAEQQAAALRNAIEAQRKFAEQMSVVPMAPTAFSGPFAPFAVPQAPDFPKPFELSDLPAAPSVATLDPESRRTEMRKYMEERRATMRKLMQEQREAAIQERDRYLEQMGRIAPEV